MTYFDPGSIIWDLASTDKYEAIREVIRSAPIFTEHPSLDVDDFCQRVIDREKLQSTGFGHGVAVAHGRTADVDAPTIALGISRDGIEYESYDGEPVHLLFIVANHPDQQMDYLHILSTLVAMVRDELFRNELLNCDQVHAVQQKLCSVFGDLLSRSRLTACSRSA